MTDYIQQACADMWRLICDDPPGSEVAIAAGCICPVMDNAHGAGYLGQPGIFVYDCRCPVHRPSEGSDQ